MGLDAWLSSDVQVQRAVETLDAYGNATHDWYAVALVPGRLVEQRQRVWSDERAEALVVTNYLLLLPGGTEVAERDQIVIGDTTYTVAAVLTRNGRAEKHLSLSVERVA